MHISLLWTSRVSTQTDNQMGELTMNEALQNQAQVDRMNEVAEDLLRAMYQAKEDDNKSADAELLLGEFMRLMGYQL